MPAAAAFTKRLHHQLDRFSKKLVRAEKRNASVELNRLHLLLEHIYPGGALQERKQSVSTFILAHGKGVLKDLLENLDPLENRFCVLHY